MINVDYLIKLYVYPILYEECKRLGVPREFVLCVYSCYWREGRAGFIEEVWEDGELKGVRIRISECNQSRGEVLKVFFHEMYHVKEKWERKKRIFSELRADLYAEFRFLKIMLSELRSPKKCFPDNYYKL